MGYFVYHSPAPPLQGLIEDDSFRTAKTLTPDLPSIRDTFCCTRRSLEISRRVIVSYQDLVNQVFPHEEYRLNRHLGLFFHLVFPLLAPAPSTI